MTILMIFSAILTFFVVYFLILVFIIVPFWRKVAQIRRQNLDKKWPTVDDFIAESNKKLTDLMEKEAKNEENRP